MIIKIAISSNFGGFYTPKGFSSENIGTQLRIDLAQYLIDNAVVSDVIGNYDDTKSNIQQIKKTDGEIIENRYFFKQSNEDKLTTNSIESLMIVEVDTNDNWTISNYDGAESVNLIPEFQRQDEFGHHEEV